MSYWSIYSPLVPTPMSIFQFPPDGKIFPIMCHGDQNSVKKMVEAKLSIVFSDDEAAELIGLPLPQCFHTHALFSSTQWMCYLEAPLFETGVPYSRSKRSLHLQLWRSKYQTALILSLTFSTVTENSDFLIVC